MKLRIAALLYIAMLCLSVSAWPQAPAVIKSETKVVAVDVVVTDKKGSYVHNLTTKDFELFEDNKPQALQSATLESSGAAADAPRTDYIVLVFDYSSMDAGDQIRARQAAVRFADATAGPSHRLAVANLDAGLQIAQIFTGDLGRVKDAINGSKAADISANARSNNFIGTSASADLGARAKFQALNRLAQELSAVPGRKTLVLFTAGVTIRSDQKGILTDAIEACNRADVAVYPVDLRDLTIPSIATADTPDTGGRTSRTAGPTTMGRGATPSLQPNASRGLSGDADSDSTSDPNGVNQQVLFALAGGTGGFVIKNAAELPTGLQKIGQEQEEYYLLSYSPPDSKEGSCHALKVKVSRSGTTLRARSSYCNGKAEEFTASGSPAQDLENRAAAAPTGTTAASMRLPYFYTGANQASVHVILEISPDAIKFEKKNQTLHADVNILGIASTAGGETASRFSDTLTLDFDEADPKWKERPIHYEQELKIAPGQYNFTVVFGTGAFSGGENFGKLTAPIAIEPYQPGQFTLSGIALGKEVRKASAISAVSLFEDRKALTVGANELVPTGEAAFAKSDQAFCYFEVYAPAHPDPGSAIQLPSIQLRIVNAKTGAAAWDSGVGRLTIPADKTSLPAGISLPIASLMPGSYALEVTAVDGGGHAVRRTESFEIK